MWMTTMSTTNLLFILVATVTTAASTASDHYLLSCGAPSSVANTTSSYDARTWYSDDNSTFSNDFSSTGVSTTSTNSFPQIPFSTARIFTSNFTYSFAVSPGPKFIRLFFFPNSSSNSYLTVQSSTGHLLLRNFSAYLSTSSYIMFKEFYVHVTASLLQLTFSPTPPSTHAFLNGIEIVSVPENLYVGPTAPKYIAKSPVEFDLTNSTALETAYRLNVGGRNVGSDEDCGTIYRQWENDERYLVGSFIGATGLYDNETIIKYTKETPNYSAPVLVYESMRWMGSMEMVNDEVRRSENVTWGLEVDLGFHYLLRLHWCEIAPEVTFNSVVFDVYINEVMADENVDVFGWFGAFTAAHKDYVVYVDGGRRNRTRGVLRLVLRPNTQSQHRFLDILLNGLEVFKISRPDGSLDAPNPDHLPILSPIQDKQPPPKSPSHINLWIIIIGAIVVFILLALIIFYLFVRRGRCFFLASTDPNSNTSSSKKLLIPFRANTGRSYSSSSSSQLQCRIFMLSDIKSATSDFSDTSIIGIGGFGIVYIGTLGGDHGPIKVAIKRLKPSSKQGTNEFRTEIEMLSNLRHEHLVRLIGYCDKQDEMILVYEYMQSGTLRDRLYNTANTPLSWKQRLQVCVGAAKGLHYLHQGGKHKIIHRDIKSSNILLDDWLVAKVSDFGLSKVGPTSEEFAHISTRVKGSLGYVDPEYYRRRQLTEKSDVYSFGVVLFEVLCGRPAVNPNLPKEQMNLTIWGRFHQKRGGLEDIVDPNLTGQIELECLRMFGEIAERCVRNNGIDRPSTAEVLQALLDICLKQAKNDEKNA